MARLRKGEIKNAIEKYFEELVKSDLPETEEFLQHRLLEKVGHCDPRSIRAAMREIPACQDFPDLFNFLLTKEVYSYSEECYCIDEGGEMHIFHMS